MHMAVDENLSKGFIRASSSPIAALVIFVKKPSTVKPPYNDMGYITISSILRSTSLIKPFSVQYYDILAFDDIVKVSHQYRYNQILIY